MKSKVKSMLIIFFDIISIVYKGFVLYLTENTINLLSVTTNSNHYTTEAVYFLLHNIYKFSSYLTGNTLHLSYVTRNSDH
jgi:hypothetical protein